MKSFFAGLVVAALFVFVVAVVPTLAHCSKSEHQTTGKVYVAMVMPADEEKLLVSELVTENFEEENSEEFSDPIESLNEPSGAADWEKMSEDEKTLILYGSVGLEHAPMRSDSFSLKGGMYSIAPGHFQKK